MAKADFAASHLRASWGASEPKVALITTTIHVPHVLKLYRAFGPDVKMFVALDKKSPFTELASWGTDLNNSWLTPTFQEQYACSEPIGWNCIQRRNIALLEALKWGADIIVSSDDDNLPLDPSYFDAFVSKLHHPFDGPCIQSFDTWFDPGNLLIPRAKHRGFPTARSNVLWGVKPIVGAKIGVCAGMCLGDPDVDAITRIATSPIVTGVSELARSGVVIDPHTTTVFNSQNTAFIRMLAPLMFMWPGVGRYDDIFASLIVQRYMREMNQHVHFGPPFIWQDRNPHDLLVDLKNEMLGMQRVEQFAAWLECQHVQGTPIEWMRDLLQRLKRDNPPEMFWFPLKSIDAGLAWCNDCEKVL